MLHGQQNIKKDKVTIYLISEPNLLCITQRNGKAELLFMAPAYFCVLSRENKHTDVLHLHTSIRVPFTQYFILFSPPPAPHSNYPMRKKSF